MKTLRLFPLELGRLLRSRLTWLVMLLTVLGPVVGLYLYQPAVSTMNSLYLANPAIAGGIAGGILFGLLAILELDRACRSRVDVLVDGSVPFDRSPDAAVGSVDHCGFDHDPYDAGVAPHQRGADRCGV